MDSLTRDEIKAWRCECGAGPEGIIWTETVSYVRNWDGERFFSASEDPHDIEVKCGKCGAALPCLEKGVIDEAINT